MERARRILESQKASKVTCGDSSLSEALVHIIGSPQFQLPVAYHSFLGVHIPYNIDSSCSQAHWILILDSGCPLHVSFKR